MKYTAIIPVLVIALLFGSCKKEGCTDSTAINYSSDAKKDDGSCRFEVTPAGVSYDIKSTMGSNQSFTYNEPFKADNGLMIEFTLCQMYLSDLALTNKSGVRTTYPETYQLIKPTQSIYYVTDLEPNTYSDFSFGFGIDSVTNNTKQPQDFEVSHVLSYQDPSMHWGWAQKYIFIKLEGKFDSDGDNVPDADFQFHVGDDKYYAEITEYFAFFDLLNGNTTTIDMNINWSKFLNGVDLKATPKAHVTNAVSDEIIKNLPDAFY
ncbi:MAG: MbnP family protein [Salibacteraceae bacterium]